MWKGGSKAIGAFPCPDRERAEVFGAEKFHEIRHEHDDFVVLPANTAARIQDLTGSEA